jgi:hypothetical protein
MIPRYSNLLCLTWLLLGSYVRSQEPPPLKTEYYEAAVNGATAINYKRWNTFRDGKLILTHEERDLTQKGVFSQIDDLVLQDGKKVVHFVTLMGKRSCFFHPQAGFKVLQSDSDGDGRYDRLVISDAREQMVESYTITVDGKITPIPDAELRKLQDMQKRFGEAMRNFDK